LLAPEHGEAGTARTVTVRVENAVRRVPLSDRVRQVCWQFGLRAAAVGGQSVPPTDVLLRPGEITLVSGPSGSGKSSTLRYLAQQLGKDALWIDTRRFRANLAVVDQVAPDLPLSEALSVLTACGFGEPRLWLRSYADLSDGEKFRARLAAAVGRAMSRPNAVLLADEFCAVLHRRLAKAICYNLRKLVSRRGLCAVVATTHDDVVADLRPDQVLRLDGRTARLERREVREGAISLFRRLHISRGKVSDYEQFKDLHYRQRAGLGPVDKVFVLRDGVGGEALGIVVYGFSPLALHLRNVATGGRYHRDGRALNHDFRILRRLVIHPDVRGCGLGHWLVARTLPIVGTKYVECLAAMGAVNPVFEKAGMVRLGTAGLPTKQEKLRRRLAELGVDPLGPDFVEVLRANAEARSVIRSAVLNWLQATTGRSIKRAAERMTTGSLAAAFIQLMGAEPVYYIWSFSAEEMDRLRGLAERLQGGGSDAEEDNVAPGARAA